MMGGGPPKNTGMSMNNNDFFSAMPMGGGTNQNFMKPIQTLPGGVPGM